jgi:hypothetical protein
MMAFMRENAILLDTERRWNAKGGAIAPQQAFSAATALIFKAANALAAHA